MMMAELKSGRSSMEKDVYYGSSSLQTFDHKGDCYEVEYSNSIPVVRARVSQQSSKQPIFAGKYQPPAFI
jgi:hypothetical protein